MLSVASARGEALDLVSMLARAGAQVLDQRLGGRVEVLVEAVEHGLS